MNWKAVGVETGKIYATGTHADCSRAVNEGKHKEAIWFMPEGKQVMLEVDEEKEIELLRIQFEESEAAEKAQAAAAQTERERKQKAEREARRILEMKVREEQREAKRVAMFIEKGRKIAERMELAKQQKAKQKERSERAKEKIARAERAKEKLAKVPRIVSDNPKSMKWTEEEESFLLENHEMELYDLLELMRAYRPKLTINALTTRLHVVRKKNGIKSARKYTHWTPEMDAYILENYGSMESCEMAVVFGVSRTSLYQRIIKLRHEGHELERAK